MLSAKETAINIRAAAKNLQELILDAYIDHEIITTLATGKHPLHPEVPSVVVKCHTELL